MEDPDADVDAGIDSDTDAGAADRMGLSVNRTPPCRPRGIPLSPIIVEVVSIAGIDPLVKLCERDRVPDFPVTEPLGEECSSFSSG